MLFKERAQRQRAERSIVELARSLGTLKAALLHAGVPVPPEARPSSALQNTVQVCQSSHTHTHRLFLTSSLPPQRLELPQGTSSEARKRAPGALPPRPPAAAMSRMAPSLSSLSSEHLDSLSLSESASDMPRQGRDRGNEISVSGTDASELEDPYFVYDFDADGGSTAFDGSSYAADDVADVLEFMPPELVEGLAQRGTVIQAQMAAQTKYTEQAQKEKLKHETRFFWQQQ